MKPHDINTPGVLNFRVAADRPGIERVVTASCHLCTARASTSSREDQSTTPKSAYAATKSSYTVTNLAADHYSWVWNNLYDVTAVSLRCFTVSPDATEHGVHELHLHRLTVTRR